MSYRELHPTKEGKRKYRFVTTGVVSAKLIGRMKDHPPCVFKDAHLKQWAQIRGGKIEIAVGYAWNGCSPKWYAGFPPIGAWLGTPDFPETILPSLIHDVLFQFAAVGKYSFDDANYQFYAMMQGFDGAAIYYDAVQRLGKRYWKKHPEKTHAYYL